MLKIPKEPQRLEDNIAVWAEFKDITEKYKCLSLGEGAPAANPPRFLRDHMMNAIDEGFNQYIRTFGHPELVKKIAEIYGKKLNRKLDPMNEVLVTQGANGALFSFIMAFINEGDEIVMFEPCFPLYLDHVRIAGGVIKPVPLEYSAG